MDRKRQPWCYPLGMQRLSEHEHVGFSPTLLSTTQWQVQTRLCCNPLTH